MRWIEGATAAKVVRTQLPLLHPPVAVAHERQRTDQSLLKLRMVLLAFNIC